MTPEIITKKGKNYAVIPYEEYQQLIEDAEMLSDIQAYDRSKIEAEESFPADIVYRIVLEKENPIKVYREYRDLTQTQLSQKSNIPLNKLIEIEVNINCASDEHKKAIAKVLNIDIEMITEVNNL